MIIKDLFKLK